MNNQKRASGVSVALNNTFKNIQNNKPILDESAKRNYTIKIANTLDEREAVFRLGYKTYLEKGYIKENDSKKLICDYDFNEETIILIVQDKEKNIVGSATLVFDDAFVLPASKVYQQELNSIKMVSKKNTEICRFVINSNCRYSKEILVLLFNYAAIYIHKVKNYDGLVIEVTPRHKNYYKELMCFEEFGGEKQCPQVQNTVGVLLYLSTQSYRNTIIELRSKSNHQKKDRSLFPYFLKLEQENLVANYLTNQATPMNEIEKQYFGYSEKKKLNLFYV